MDYLLGGFSVGFDKLTYFRKWIPIEHWRPEFLVKGVSYPHSWFERWLIIGGYNWLGFNEGSFLSAWLPSLVVNGNFIYFSQLIWAKKRLVFVWGASCRRELRGLSFNGVNLHTKAKW